MLFIDQFNDASTSIQYHIYLSDIIPELKKEIFCRYIISFYHRENNYFSHFFFQFVISLLFYIFMNAKSILEIAHINFFFNGKNLFYLETMFLFEVYLFSRFNFFCQGQISLYPYIKG